MKKQMKTFPEKLKLHEVIPYLDLPSNKRGNINLSDFKQKKKLVIIFHHGSKCAQCAQKLKELAQIYPKVEELEAEIIAVSFDSIAEARNDARESEIPFPLLYDSGGEATERFTYIDESRHTPYPSLFITDRFGVLRYQKIVHEADALPHGKEILDWLLLIQTECPECSHL